MAPNNGGGRIVQLGPMARAIAQIFRAPKESITGVSTDQQFGPLQPFRPMGGDGAQPWVSQIQPGQNLVYTPRAREPLNAAQLREASMYDLVRIIIENVEDQVSRIPLNIRLKRKLGEAAKDYAKRKPDIGILNAIGQFLDRPNADQTRAQFIRQALDDMLTIDAASVLVRRTARGDVFDFRAIDGAQIARYFDAWGGTPQPPSPAYAQIWDAGMSGGTGIPWVDLRTDQLLYAMRNLKTYRLYGLSPTEQAVQMIRTAGLRLDFQQDYYTAGSIPDAIQIVPPSVSSDKLKEGQKVLNSELSGILTKRRQIRLIQGYNDSSKDDQILFPKEPLLKDEFDDYVIRVLCYCFGTSPQRLQRVAGMRSGQVNQEGAEKEGLEPWLDWAENCLWGPMVQRYLGFPDYEATYEEDSHVDPTEQMTIDTGYVKVGIRTINQVREALGDEPLDEPEADMSLIVTATGAVPLSMEAQVKQQQAMTDAMPKPEPKPGGPQKLAKRAATIDPGKPTVDSRHAQGRIEAAIVKVFQRQKEKARNAAERVFKVRKGDDAEKKADAINEAIAAEWAALPSEVRSALEEAARSGGAQAIVQLEISEGKLLSSVNENAASYAEKRAAEMVGMRFNEEGELVPNPSAKWAISDTTRDRLRQIVQGAFEEKQPFSELIQDLMDADIFSEKRAAMIARTEVSNAQVRSNFDVWQKSGLVKTVKWLAVGPDPCPICLANNEQNRELGKAFPSGDRYPTAHPNCYCILQAVEFNE